MSLKYIIFDNALPIIFGKYFIHKDVALRTQRLSLDVGGKAEVTGAGFVAGDGDTWVAYGRSESLDKIPGIKDSEILTKVLNNR